MQSSSIMQSSSMIGGVSLTGLKVWPVFGKAKPQNIPAGRAPGGFRTVWQVSQPPRGGFSGKPGPAVHGRSAEDAGRTVQNA